jgi:site-specific recombinase XerD
MKAEALIQRTIDVLRRQHKALATEEAYCGWLRRYFSALQRMPRDWSRERKAEAFLTALARRDVSAATQNSAFHAIVYFYKDVIGEPLQKVDALRASRPAQLRHAPSVGETRALLDTVRDVGGYPTRLIVKLLYGCGLRVSEPLNLRVKDVAFEDSRLFILGAKGRKDRVVALPCSLVEELREQLVYARALWQRDRMMRVPVEMPHQLAAKYPEYAFAWPWAWVYPSHQPCRHPRTGAIVRWRCHEANVQRAVRDARRSLGIAVTPHELRHAYATHSLNRGVNIKALSAAMGHAQIETTAGYCHAEACGVPSPLETIYG